jgi:hypothetical protein
MARAAKRATKKSAWTDERRERFRSTMAAKRSARADAALPEQPTDLRMTVNGNSYGIDEAMAIYSAVKKILELRGS